MADTAAGTTGGKMLLTPALAELKDRDRNYSRKWDVLGSIIGIREFWKNLFKTHELVK
jgi:hypothetical protein